MGLKPGDPFQFMPMGQKASAPPPAPAQPALLPPPPPVPQLQPRDPFFPDVSESFPSRFVSEDRFSTNDRFSTDDRFSTPAAASGSSTWGGGGGGGDADSAARRQLVSGMGFEDQAVAAVQAARLAEAGRPYPTIEQLAEAVLANLSSLPPSSGSQPMGGGGGGADWQQVAAAEAEVRRRHSCFSFLTWCT